MRSPSVPGNTEHTGCLPALRPRQSRRTRARTMAQATNQARSPKSADQRNSVMKQSMMSRMAKFRAQHETHGPSRGLRCSSCVVSRRGHLGIIARRPSGAARVRWCESATWCLSGRARENEMITRGLDADMEGPRLAMNDVSV